MSEHILDYRGPSGPPASPRPQARQFHPSTVAWVMVFILMALIGLAAPDFIPGMAILAVCLTYCIRAIQRRRAMTVLSYVEEAVRLNLPLPRALRAAAQSERGYTAEYLQSLATSVEDGMPLNAAIGSEVHGIPRRALGLLNAGQRLASLPRVLAMLIARKRIDKSGRPAVRICLLYAGMLLTAIFALLLLYSVVLAPKFMEIFRDFGIQPPTFMRLLSERGAPVLSGVLIACGVLLLIYAVAAIWARFRPLGYEQTRQGFIGWLIWHTPFARIVARDRGLADLCSIVGDGLRAGFSFNDALESALDLAINPALKKKVRRWLGLMQEGEGISDAARRVGLPALVVGMLGTAQLSGGMVETFGFLGRYYETRFSRAVVLFESALPPLTSLACGALVCVIVVNMFLPLIQLIQAAGVPWHKL